MGPLPFLEVKVNRRKFQLFIQSEFKELEVCHLNLQMDNVRIQMELLFLATLKHFQRSVIQRKLNYTKLLLKKLKLYLICCRILSFTFDNVLKQGCKRLFRKSQSRPAEK